MPTPPVVVPTATAAASSAPTVHPVSTPEAAPEPTPAVPAPSDPDAVRIELLPIATDLDQPTQVTHAGDGSGRLFVVEKEGRVRIVDDNALQSQPFLDIVDRVGSESSEQGLLSIAFHPRYRENGRFFVNYTDKNGDTVVTGYRVSSDAAVADRGSEQVLLSVEQPAANHNGGQLAFGPDGYLYIGMGDGGGAQVRREHAQAQASLMGKLLRIDVDQDEPYAVPADNPLAGTAGARPEIWALGLRNPWRFSFDRETGDLFIADVGENETEEINLLPAGGSGGQNYGWGLMQGSQCYRPPSGCDPSQFALPIAEYSTSVGCAVIGGVRYRGAAVPAFAGAYFFTDYCAAQIWTLTAEDGGWKQREFSVESSGISSFGEDEQGEIYAVTLSPGSLYRISAAPK